MFKKCMLIGSIVISGLLIGCDSDSTGQTVNNDNINQEINTSNEYIYKITTIEGNKVNGMALNNYNDDNSGIFLLQDQLDVKLNVGDKISVTYGKYYDDIKTIEIIEQAVNNNETLNCTIYSLDDYGFEQVGNHKEYVCANENDNVDFIIIEDKDNSINVNDNMTVELNEHNEVLSQNIN